jgi:hypothetical protein
MQERYPLMLDFVWELVLKSVAPLTVMNIYVFQLMLHYIQVAEGDLRETGCEDMSFIQAIQGSNPVAGSCKHGNEFLNSTKDNLFYSVRHRQFLNKDRRAF